MICPYCETVIDEFDQRVSYRKMTLQKKLEWYENRVSELESERYQVQQALKDVEWLQDLDRA